MAEDCLFCGIVAGTVPADIVYADDAAVAFRDINPQAPVHVLVVPREHVVDLRELGGRPDLAGPYVAAIGKVADNLDAPDFRTVFNTGAPVGQSVFHIHAHLLAGRPMGWPPG
ncbi:MAG: hypothetical protein QOE97_2029 [Pseudonocardiales bacterium]|jgi:histidine triad (HIT) family protein|nr:hypothetical protein [Pseudonocardiales bacterium]